MSFHEKQRLTGPGADQSRIKRVDLHVHSHYSNNPSEWFFKKVGARESYTTVPEVYRLAKSQGMDFVTITDHDTIDGARELVRLYPREAFIGVEVTTRFPEDGCKIHLLVYGITPEQFETINAIRMNIYKVRDYIKQNGIAHSVAHATYAVNGKLSMAVFEKLILLFDVFEGINGARHPLYNQTWTQVLESLTPLDIDRLYARHLIEPFSDDPWIKGITGGSDDHAGLFVGKTFTLAECRTKEQLIRLIKDKRTFCSGRNNNFKTMAFMIYKIGYEYFRRKEETSGHQRWRIMNNIVFENRGPGLKDRFFIRQLKKRKGSRGEVFARFSERLVEDLIDKTLDPEEKMDIIYTHLSSLVDHLLRVTVTRCARLFHKSKAGPLGRELSKLLPNALITTSFLASIKHLYPDRRLLKKLNEEFLAGSGCSGRKILWFTDTVSDLNGVSVTLRQIARVSGWMNLPLKLVACSPEMTDTEEGCGHIMNLHSVLSYVPDFYRSYRMHFPSLLKSLELVARERPTEIVISTPGPVGLLGLLVSRLMGVPCTGVYHSDFTRQMEFDIGDGKMPKLFEAYTRWFYSQMQEIRVPTAEYIHILESRGFQTGNMKIFRRGIDNQRFKPLPEAGERLKRRLGIKDGLTLLWAGRVSKDKNVDFLAELYRILLDNRTDINLVVAGNGPALSELKETFADCPRVVFTGQVNREELAPYYSMADLFVFPSTTDTFGMVILEAQACGLPVLVTDIGGPQEIMADGKTGFILPAHDAGLWARKIEQIAGDMLNKPDAYLELRRQARQYVLKNFSWTEALSDLLGPFPDRGMPAPVYESCRSVS